CGPAAARRSRARGQRGRGPGEQLSGPSSAVGELPGRGRGQTAQAVAPRVGVHGVVPRPGAGAPALGEQALLGLEPAGDAHRRDHHGDRGELVVAQIALHQAHVRGAHRCRLLHRGGSARGGCGAGGVGRGGGTVLAGAHSGMFPCFLVGSVSRLVRRARSARATSRRVSAGRITPSIQPRSAAVYGVANCSSYSASKRVRAASTSPPCSATSRRSPRWRMFTAPCEPITAIWAVGQARLMSAPSSLEPITMYAPPYALRVMTVISGTVASA